MFGLFAQICNKVRKPLQMHRVCIFSGFEEIVQLLIFWAMHPIFLKWLKGFWAIKSALLSFYIIIRKLFKKKFLSPLKIGHQECRCATGNIVKTVTLCNIISLTMREAGRKEIFWQLAKTYLYTNIKSLR